jgi:hypothetical protein
MKNYIPDDHESQGNASLIAWINPDYDTSRCTALQHAHTTTPVQEIPA